jgi:spermidine/putrescine transport system substrate-binding protein
LKKTFEMMQRRQFISHTGAAAISAAWLTGCRREKDTTSLRVLSWMNYFSPNKITEFEQAHGCRIEIIHFSSNEKLLNRLAAGESADVLVPTTYMRKILAEQGRICHFKAAGAELIATPYLRGISGLGWSADHPPPDSPCSWGWVAARQSRSATMLDDVRETLGAALKFLGYSANSLNEGEVKQAAVLVQEWKQGLAGFESEYYKVGLIAGEYDIVHGYSGDLFQAFSKYPNLRFGLPQEGALMSTDELCVSANSKNKELAADFIAFQTSPAALEEHSSYTGFQRVDVDARTVPKGMPEFTQSAFEKSEEIASIGEVQDLWLELWREIRKD